MSRRDLIRALGAVGVTTIGAGILVACGDSSSEGTTDGGTTAAADAAAGGGSVPVADVPVGEARVVDLNGKPVVVARTAEATAVAFSASCTHAGTTVQATGGFALLCPNHGSEFNAEDGSATKGPATTPLATLTATIEGDQIVIA